MHVDHNMHVIGCNMHVTCTLFRIGWAGLWPNLYANPQKLHTTAEPQYFWEKLWCKLKGC